MTVLEEIQSGSTAQIDAFVLQSKNYRKSLSDVCHSLANLEYDLTEAQLCNLKQYNECIVQMRSAAEIEAFRLGMLIGAKLSKEQQEMISA